MVVVFQHTLWPPTTVYSNTGESVHKIYMIGHCKLAYDPYEFYPNLSLSPSWNVYWIYAGQKKKLRIQKKIISTSSHVFLIDILLHSDILFIFKTKFDHSIVLEQQLGIKIKQLVLSQSSHYLIGRIHCNLVVDHISVVDQILEYWYLYHQELMVESEPLESLIQLLLALLQIG